MTKVYQHQFPNGLCLIAEPVADAQSLAMSFRVPAGLTYEQPDQLGIASLVAEMICRGAGDRDSKAHSDALDQLGVQRATSVETSHCHLGATMISSKLPDALPLLVDMIRRPTLAQSALDPSRDLALQALDALEDEPQQKVFYELRQRHYPQPFGRSSLGNRQHLKAITLQHIRQHWQRCFVADKSILAFAGRFDWTKLKEQVQQLLGDWAGSNDPPTEQQPAPRGYHHVTAPTTQVHIGLAYQTIPQPDPDSMLQHTAVAVLSGGMSGRLFTQVREKRGLCYAVYASYAAQKRHGAILGYAGTTAPRAQETLDVLTAEIRRLSDGIDQQEFDRAVVGMKSRLVMHGESTTARAHAIASDQYIYNRPRTLEQLTDQVDALTLEQLSAFVKENPPGKMTVVTVGPDKLQPPK